MKQSSIVNINILRLSTGIIYLAKARQYTIKPRIYLWNILLCDVDQRPSMKWTSILFSINHVLLMRHSAVIITAPMIHAIPANCYTIVLLLFYNTRTVRTHNTMYVCHNMIVSVVMKKLWMTDKYFIWILWNSWRNHGKTIPNKTMCIFIVMSLIVLYFLHNTSVLSFYIDIVLVLSIEHTLLADVAERPSLKCTWIPFSINHIILMQRRLQK